MSYFKVRNPLNEKQALVQGSSDIVASDILGQGFASTLKIDDSAPASVSVLWTSDKIDGAFQGLVSPAVAGNLATLDASGQVLDSGLKVNDAAAAGAGVLWTSDKIDGAFQGLVSPAVAGNLATLDASGQVVDSGLKVDDTAAPSAGVIYSSDKVSSLINSPNVFVRGAFAAVPVGPSTTLSCVTPFFNIGGGWSVNVFTAPIAGVYMVGATLHSDGSGSGVSNDSSWGARALASTGQFVYDYTFYRFAEAGPYNHSVSINGVLNLAVGDTVTFFGEQSTGLAITLRNPPGCSFYVCKV